MYPPTLLQLILQWDKDVSFLLYRFYQTHIPSRLPLLLLEVSGHGVPWLMLPIAIFLFKPNLSPTAAALMVNFLLLTLLDLAAIGLLKPLFHRKRPAYNTGIGHVTIHIVDQFSFPSGHATRAGFVTAFILLVQRLHPDGLHRSIACPAFFGLTFLWATAICVSRVALGRHHVLDVVVGAFLGASYVLLWQPFWIGPAFSASLRDALRSAILGTPQVAKAAYSVHTYL